MVGLCRERVEGTLVHVRSAGDLLVCAVGAFALNLQQMAPTSLLGKSQHTGDEHFTIVLVHFRSKTFFLFKC